MSTDTTLIKESLWGLSNIVYDSEQSALGFLMHDGLRGRVMVLMHNPSVPLRGEACWVIANCLTKVNTADSRFLTCIIDESKDLLEGIGVNLDFFKNEVIE